MVGMAKGSPWSTSFSINYTHRRFTILRLVCRKIHGCMLIRTVKGSDAGYVAAVVENFLAYGIVDWTN